MLHSVVSGWGGTMTWGDRSCGNLADYGLGDIMVGSSFDVDKVEHLLHAFVNRYPGKVAYMRPQKKALRGD